MDMDSQEVTDARRSINDATYNTPNERQKVIADHADVVKRILKHLVATNDVTNFRMWIAPMFYYTYTAVLDAEMMEMIRGSGEHEAYLMAMFGCDKRYASVIYKMMTMTSPDKSIFKGIEFSRSFIAVAMILNDATVTATLVSVYPYDVMDYISFVAMPSTIRHLSDEMVLSFVPRGVISRKCIGLPNEKIVHCFIRQVIMTRDAKMIDWYIISSSSGGGKEDDEEDDDKDAILSKRVTEALGALTTEKAIYSPPSPPATSSSSPWAIGGILYVLTHSLVLIPIPILTCLANNPNTIDAALITQPWRVGGNVSIAKHVYFAISDSISISSSVAICTTSLVKGVLKGMEKEKVDDLVSILDVLRAVDDARKALIRDVSLVDVVLVTTV